MAFTIARHEVTANNARDWPEASGVNWGKWRHCRLRLQVTITSGIVPRKASFIGWRARIGHRTEKRISRLNAGSVDWKQRN